MDGKKNIISLIGPPNSGKDTIANFLVKNYSFQRFAFADEIKRQYYTITGHSEEELKEARGTKLEEEIRNGLWSYGDRIKNEKGQLYFVNILISAIQKCSKPIIVTDTRTYDELDAMRNVGSKIVLVFKLSCNQKLKHFDKLEKIPGSRIFYKDIRQDDEIFVNYENDSLDKVEKSIESWFMGSGKK